jgi:C-terminal processing protease CtpA/Prc
VAVLLAMLAPLRDLHIWLVDPRGQVVPSYKPSQVINFEQARWSHAMRDAAYFVRAPSVGDGYVGGYAYMHIGTWKAPVDEELLEVMLQRARDAQGLIIDVRTNAGGSDAAALAFAGRFTRKPFAASYVRINTDPRVTGVEMPLARTIAPRGSWQFTRPVVVISGRGGFSATESFVAAMRTLPQVTVIGDTTGGASGNPATYPLGNGWQFTVPRWFEYGPDRQPIEWRGVAPHLTIAWHPSNYDSTRDPLIDAAVGLLGERTGVYRIAPAMDAPAARQQDRQQEPQFELQMDPRDRRLWRDPLHMPH